MKVKKDTNHIYLSFPDCTLVIILNPCHLDMLLFFATNYPKLLKSNSIISTKFKSFSIISRKPILDLCTLHSFFSKDIGGVN